MGQSRRMVAAESELRSLGGVSMYVSVTRWGDRYGVRISAEDISTHLPIQCQDIVIEIDGAMHQYRLPRTFRSSGHSEIRIKPVSDWLKQNCQTNWVSGNPIAVMLTHVHGGRFRLHM